MQNKNSLKLWQKIYVNRSLNFAKIKAIGFDMDHTLAVYNREAFEELAFNLTLEKFIAQGYPKELRNLKFDPNFIIRGLLVDIKRGNILKVDGHKYVKIAYHGRKKLDREERNSLYNKESFKADSLVSVDTFFALSEIQLYAEIVEYMAKNPGIIHKSFQELYHDVKYYIDLSHRDGSIKSEVVQNLRKYVKKDKSSIQAIQKLRDAGKILFLATNSYWEYTDHIMSYILAENNKPNRQWLEFFDFVIVGSSKPGFFIGSQPFYEVMHENGLLRIHDGLSLDHKIYHGGNAKLLQKLAKVSGDEILYVGDHIYGDIIHSKDRFNWRTMLIIDELDNEFKQLSGQKKNLDEIHRILHQREVLEEQHHHLVNKISSMMNKFQNENKKFKETKNQQKLLDYQNELMIKDKKIQELAKKIDFLLAKRSQVAHPVWGELMRTGLERSRFAEQVTDYACIYSTKVSNFNYYSPFKKFTSAKESLPHEV